MSDMHCTLTARDICDVLSYDQHTGLFTHTKSKGSTRAGSPALSMCSQGYFRVKIDGKSYKQHRLAWFLIYGEWPEMIDHINRDKSDNRIANLRKATNKDNQMNRDLPSRINKAGYLGVNWNHRMQKYAARIKCGVKRIHIGYFDSPELASQAYNAKKLELSKFCPKTSPLTPKKEPHE